MNSDSVAAVSAVFYSLVLLNDFDLTGGHHSCVVFVEFSGADMSFISHADSNCSRLI